LIALNQFYIAEASKFMKENIPDNFIDLIITSPPYDNLRTYKGFVFDYKSILKELYRVTKDGGVVVWIIGDATINGSETGTSFKQALYAKEECGFRLHDTMIYQKDACPFPEINRYYPSFEYMFVFSKGKPKTVNLIKDKPNKRYGEKVASSTQRQPDGTTIKVSANKINPDRQVKEFGVRTNVWFYSPGYMKSTKDKIAYKHPAQFPEKLAEDHIKSWSNEGDIVFDPMCGAGTTCKMAWLNNRKFIGVDISEEYINEICIPRLKQYGWSEDKVEQIA
jgi:site-specific DNA-methyltransferase (adenine-specific)